MVQKLPAPNFAFDREINVLDFAPGIGVESAWVANLPTYFMPRSPKSRIWSAEPLSQCARPPSTLDAYDQLTVARAGERTLFSRFSPAKQARMADPTCYGHYTPSPSEAEFDVFDGWVWNDFSYAHDPPRLFFLSRPASSLRLAWRRHSEDHGIAVGKMPSCCSTMGKARSDRQVSLPDDDIHPGLQ